jgi:methylphosphotriester-DNA--protein-cysteine methyltransferase
MKTKYMLELLKTAGYPLSLVAAQAGVSYMKAHRYVKGEGRLTYEEKARLWRFGKAQPVVEEALGIEIEEEGE